MSCLQVDGAIGQAGRVTLSEVEALDALEPYGDGNARPVFCLRGATLDRVQNVGQNRHLKLRLSKGSAQFDGIFFSVRPRPAAWSQATGWTPRFTCKSTSSAAAARCSCRWWTAPSLPAAPGRRSPWQLVGRRLREELRPRDAVRHAALPGPVRGLWRACSSRCPPMG